MKGFLMRTNSYHIFTCIKKRIKGLTDPSRFGQDVYRLDLTNLTWKLLVVFKLFFSNSAVKIGISQACIGEPPVHRDFHSATAIGLKYSYSLDPHKFLDLWSQGSLMFIFGGRSDLTGGQWHVNMGPDYYSNKVK